MNNKEYRFEELLAAEDERDILLQIIAETRDELTKIHLLYPSSCSQDRKIWAVINRLTDVIGD